ncbi:golgin subfamily A member 6-like protein 22, partial [Siniperca chuatsi]|uniref:golgin subfamily A member 6-like protein 22 n=1 Tax=Siniperca chuatsi TaxID=119488 RepID=UPI001CE1C522
MDRRNENISMHESQISSLKQSLQLREEQVDVTQHQSKYDKIAARLEDFRNKRKKLSEQNDQTFKATSESQNSVQQQLHQRDNEILDLRKEKEGLSQKLTEARKKLWTQRAALVLSERAWQTKYEEKFRMELAEKQQTWEARVQQVEEENKELTEREQIWKTIVKQMEEENKELAEKQQNWEARVKQVEEENKEMTEREQIWKTIVKQMEEENKELAEKQQSWEARVQQVEEEHKELEEEEDIKQKEKAEMKKKAKEEEKQKKEMKKKAKEEKVEMKRKEKEEKKQKKEMKK